MNCPRCQGLMVVDVYTSTQWSDLDATSCYRCVVCGNYEDSVILQHRKQPVNLRTGATPRMAGTVKR